MSDVKALPRLTLDGFVKQYELTLVVEEVLVTEATTGQRSPRWHAHIKNAEIMERGGLLSAYGDGTTPEAAREDYRQRISTQRLAIGAYTHERREIDVPILVAAPTREAAGLGEREDVRAVIHDLLFQWAYVDEGDGYEPLAAVAHITGKIFTALEAASRARAPEGETFDGRRAAEWIGTFFALRLDKESKALLADSLAVFARPVEQGPADPWNGLSPEARAEVEAFAAQLEKRNVPVPRMPLDELCNIIGGVEITGGMQGGPWTVLHAAGPENVKRIATKLYAAVRSGAPGEDK